MNITLYTSFSKRKNSTKTPTGGTVVSNVELKKPTSLHDPIFVLGPVTGVTMENVTYIKAFNHYFFVTDITVTPHDYFEITCTEDPMASNKSGILASNQYVLYSASSYDYMIPDGRIVSDSNEVTIVGHDCNDFALNTTGCFVITVVNCKHGNYFTTAYVMDDLNLMHLAWYFNSDIWSGYGTLETWLETVVGAGYEAVISLKWIPIKYADVPGTAATIWIGNHDVSWVDDEGHTITVEGKQVPTGAASTLSNTGHIYPTWHYLNDWRLAKPYTSGKLYLPGYGMLDINPIEFRTTLTFLYAVDMLSGDCTVYLYGNGNKLISTITFNIAVDVPIAQLATKGLSPIVSLIGSGATLAAAAATGGAAAFAGMAAGAAGLAKSTSDFFFQTPSYKGAQGGRSWTGMNVPGLLETYIDTQDLNEFITTQGRPLMQEVTLSTLSGFCQCANASVDLNCMESDRDFINNCLNSGFFIE